MVAQHGDFFGKQQVIVVGLVNHVFQLMAIGHQDDIPIGKSGFLGGFAECHTLGNVGKADYLFTLGKDNTRVDNHRQQQVEQHTAQHNQQALPRCLAAELPRLGGLLHGLGVHRLVDHARDGAVATQGYPSDAILGGTPRVLVLAACFVFLLHGAHFAAKREPLKILAWFPLDQ